MTRNALPSPSAPDLGDAETASRFYLIAGSAEHEDGQPPFSDQSLIDLRTGAKRALMLEEKAIAVLSDAEAEFVVHPSARGNGLGTAMLEAILGQAPGSMLIWSHGDHPAARALAASHGLQKVRELLQLRAPVVAPASSEAFAPFRPGVDDSAWLALNAVAFADHPEQGSVSQADLDELKKEEWFNADDFLLAWDGDELAGYCWLKVENSIGEIYVIGVDPARQGEGFGRRLMNAGLARLASSGIQTAALYVEADNHPARALYASLGFQTWSADVQYRS